LLTRNGSLSLCTLVLATLASCFAAGAEKAEAPKTPAPIILHAKNAVVHGTAAHYEFGPERDNIGFWTRLEDYVSWDLTVEEPGTFLVQITTATPPDSAGAEYAVAIGGHTLTSVVRSTGGWGKFVTENLGIVDLDRPGTYPVTVKPITKPKGAVMNLQAIILRQGPWERGVAAWWRFDEGEGTETRDELTGAADAVAFARWTRGVEGTALRFNGYSSYVSRAAALAPRFRDGFSVEAWVKLLGEPDGWCAIVNQHNYPLGYYFGLDGAGDFGLHLGAGGKWWACAAAARLPVKQWTHLAATFDKRFGILLYADGREAGRLRCEGELTPAPDTDLLIGKHNLHPWVFNVAIDDVRLYGRPLSAAEIQKHYAAGRAQIQPPPKLILRSVVPDRLTARAHERVTLDVGLAATYDNPFDPDDVRLDAIAATPSLKTLHVPGFLYQPFERWQEGDREGLAPDGPPRWQVRLSFAEPGPHHLRVAASDRTGDAVSDLLRIDVLATDTPGMVRRANGDHRYFVTDRGESFFPVGANVCWGGGQGTYSYDEWLPRYAASGCNFFRVWLSPFWTTFGMNTAASGADAIDLGNAWRLDHVLETAERLGLRMMPCIDSFNILLPIARSPGNYEQAPYPLAQGGPLARPIDYFTNPWSLKLYRDRLRYLVARYGYSPSLFAWELWNEVDIVDGYDSKVIAAWHAEMARTLRHLDPWRHLITTSFASPHGDPAVMGLPELDFAQPHCYGAKDMVKDLFERLPAVDRPCFYGEFGIDGDGKKTAETDPTGIHLHNALYASVGQGQAGAPMTWWWDSYVDPKNLYPVFAAFARWIGGFDFVAQRARPAEAQVVCADLVLKEPTTLRPVKGSWDPAPANQPLTVSVDRDGLMTYAVGVSELLHGLGFHKDKHNPVTFQLDAPEAGSGGKFGVEVKGISGYGDANLQISLDGKLVLEKAMPLPSNPKDVVHDYDAVYAIDLPAGTHTVKVENTGKDWISVASYQIPWLRAVKSVADPLRALGVVGEGKALLWVQNKLHTWPVATAKDYRPQPVKGATLHVLGLAPGRWTIEHWDTQKGEVTRTEQATVGEDGKLVIALPDISWDAAFRLRKGS